MSFIAAGAGTETGRYCAAHADGMEQGTHADFVVSLVIHKAAPR
jgi:hypothetical protein